MATATLASYWFIKQHFCSDWLEYVAQDFDS